MRHLIDESVVLLEDQHLIQGPQKKINIKEALLLCSQAWLDVTRDTIRNSYLKSPICSQTPNNEALLELADVATEAFLAERELVREHILVEAEDAVISLVNDNLELNADDEMGFPIDEETTTIKDLIISDKEGILALEKSILYMQ